MTSTTTPAWRRLGLDKADIEDLIFHLEDELGLTAFTAEEDRMLKTARTANDLRPVLDGDRAALTWSDLSCRHSLRME